MRSGGQWLFSRVARLGGCALLLGATLAARAGAVDETQSSPPLTVEAYGDSITAGFLSYTDVTAPPGIEEVGRIFNDLFQYIAFKNPARLPRHHSPQLAWPKVLADMLGARGERVQVRNFAKSGDHVYDLTAQIGRAPEVTSPAAAFFFIGHNDMCKDGGTPDEVAAFFVKHYEKALSDWDKKHAGATAYVMPMGDIYRVFKALQGVVWQKNATGNLTCETSWLRYFPYCPAHAHRLQDGTLQQFIEPKLSAINRALVDLVEKLKLSKRGNRYVFLDKVLTRPYEPDYFAIDCYHLSARGQREVATDVFDSIVH